MSNLGWYQLMTTVAKRVGGPKNLFLLVAGGGAAVGAGVTKAYPVVVRRVKGLAHGKKAIKVQATVDSDIFIITSEGKDSSGLEFHAGDKFRMLEHDGEAILIEKIGDTNNPYFVSDEFLKQVCDNYRKADVV